MQKLGRHRMVSPAKALPFIVLIFGGYAWMTQVLDRRTSLADQTKNASLYFDETGTKPRDPEELIEQTLEEVRNYGRSKSYEMVKVPRPVYTEVMGGHNNEDDN